MKEENKDRTTLDLALGLIVLLGFIPILLIGLIMNSRGVLIGGVLYGFFSFMFFLAIGLNRKK